MGKAPVSRGAVIGLVIGFAVFMVVIAYLVVSSLAPRAVTEFEITPVSRRASPPDSLVVDTVTIDAGDSEAWRFFDFATGAVMDPPDTAGWDLAFRRFHVVTSGAAVDLGALAFDDVSTVPADGYVATTSGADTVNAVLDRWYRYNFLSHVLEPGGHMYALRTDDGRYAKVEFLAYYCPGTVPGCVTFRYAYQGGGSRRVGVRPRYSPSAVSPSG